jgi:hypothetical protein
MLSVPIKASATELLVSVSASLDMRVKVARELHVLMIALVMVDASTSRTYLLELYLLTIPLQASILRILMSSLTTIGIIIRLVVVYVILSMVMLIVQRDYANTETISWTRDQTFLLQ